MKDLISPSWSPMKIGFCLRVLHIQVTIEGQVLPYQAPGIKNTFVREWTGGKKRDGDMAICRVEEVALQHYKELGYEEGIL